MNRLTTQASIIIATFIFTVGALIATGTLMPTPKTYATVKFDGGYQKLGLISYESVFTQASIELNGDKFVSGDFDDVINALYKHSDIQAQQKTPLKSGASINYSTGIKWSGSESNFKLTINSGSITSTDAKPLYVQEAVEQLRSIEKKAKADRVANAKEALDFSAPPSSGTFLLAKLLSTLSK